LSSQNRFSVRIVVASVGLVAILTAIFADQMGLDRSKGFNFGQLLLLVVGFLVFLVAVLGSRFPRVYRFIAVTILSTALIIGAIELGLRIFSTLSRGSVTAAGFVGRLDQHYRNFSYYRGKEWSEQFWNESRSSSAQRYAPYVVWKARGLSGETINTSETGDRKTPGARCAAGALRVFVLGGSTVWGSGSPDWETLPAHLQTGLASTLPRPVCVVNLGQVGYVATQCLVDLLIRIEAGERPDIVIFYAGVNDIFAAYQSGLSIVHQNLAEVASRFDTPPRALGHWMADLEVVKLGVRLLRNPEPSSAKSPGGAECGLVEERGREQCPNLRDCSGVIG
jgi:hypothetical protein